MENVGPPEKSYDVTDPSEKEERNRRSSSKEHAGVGKFTNGSVYTSLGFPTPGSKWEKIIITKTNMAMENPHFH